jgi:predicted CxxxxCH...CXXCH cytochrome family protein
MDACRFVCAIATVMLVAACSEARPFDGDAGIGLNSDTCRACHGSAQSAAPPRDVAGNFDESAIGVGAHQAHLQAEHGISAPIACSTCHVVPTHLDSPGHIDHPLPAYVEFGGLAVADSASPSWSHARASCSATYCHGNGASLARDASAGLNRTPIWTAGSSQVYCGSCHGIPPRDPTHDSLSIGITDCYRCHAGTVDRGGNILVSGPEDARTSLHVNGVVDVQAAP